MLPPSFLSAVRVAGPVGLALLLATAAGVSAACSNPTVRKEWNQLTSDEKTEYVAALKAVIAKGLQGSVTPGTMGYYDFVQKYVSSVVFAANS
ncbi:hypothetical protein HK405_001600 [Cladochytrium tenue]|nr:hypothetical protein HK405_001600 [Cladochytrium tenue]